MPCSTAERGQQPGLAVGAGWGHDTRLADPLHVNRTPKLEIPASNWSSRCR
jgi:hypothetical protein